MARKPPSTTKALLIDPNDPMMKLLEEKPELRTRLLRRMLEEDKQKQKRQSSEPDPKDR
jgi:hypothetical protein